MLTMLVSAPSAWSGYSGRALCAASYRGNLTAGTEYTSEYGVRPVVCLKSTVSAQKDANGIWQLQ